MTIEKKNTDRYEYLRDEYRLPSDQRRRIKQASFLLFS